MDGCCPIGVDCIPPSSCDIVCGPEDEVCGTGCCLLGSVCLEDDTCGSPPPSESPTIPDPETFSETLTIPDPVTFSETLTIPDPVTFSETLTVPDPVTFSETLTIPDPVTFSETDTMIFPETLTEILPQEPGTTTPRPKTTTPLPKTSVTVTQFTEILETPKTSTKNIVTSMGPGVMSPLTPATSSRKRVTKTQTVNGGAPLPTMDVLLGGVLGIAAGYLANM